MASANRARAMPCMITRARISLLPYFSLNSPPLINPTMPVASTARVRNMAIIITIGSVADRTTFPENAGYAAGKFGARAMHEVLRQELRGSGVRVSLVSPGPTDTAIWDPIDPDSRPGFTPRARMLRADAVADAVLWLATRPADVNIDELRLSHS